VTLTATELQRLSFVCEQIAQTLLRRIDEADCKGSCVIRIASDEADAMAIDIQLAADAARALHGLATTTGVTRAQ
jgi:hypothetical protein